MKKGISLCALGMLAIFLSTTPALGQSGADMYKAKCASCHGVDGKGSAIGKKLGAHDFSSPEVAKMSDAELADAISKGKNKMPAYKTLSEADVKALVAHIRELSK